jgi:hypothetical protein
MNLSASIQPLRIFQVRPFWAVVFLVLITPFEEFVFKYAPVSDLGFFALRFTGEGLVYLALLLLVVDRSFKRQPLVRTPLDKPLLGLLLVALISLVLNQSPLVGSLVSMRPFVRYVLLFYLVANLTLSDRDVMLLLRLIVWAGLLQLLLGVVQAGGHPAVYAFFSPRTTAVEVAGYSKTFILVERGRELGALFGTLGDTLLFGLFLMIVMVVVLVRFGLRSVVARGLLLAIFCAIALSYSRAATLAAGVGFLVWVRYRYGVRSLVRLLLIGGILGGLLLTALSDQSGGYANPRKKQQDIIENMTGIFTPEYIEVAKKQRLGALIGTLPTVLNNRPLVGYGPDQEHAIEGLNASQTSFLLKVLDQGGFKDVYWVAFTAFYGIAGLVLLGLVFYRLQRAGVRAWYGDGDRLTRQLGLLMAVLVPMTVFLLFFNRAIEFRAYGVYFWLFAGLLFCRKSFSSLGCRYD